MLFVWLSQKERLSLVTWPFWTFSNKSETCFPPVLTPFVLMAVNQLIIPSYSERENFPVSTGSTGFVFSALLRKQPGARDKEILSHHL